ncbi:cysteine hydrolase [Paenibacillus arenosi]|uniref:Cysteine hydrolase n=1 Tax=Paenibacillus arenosi TaxID=2774142 RepID=A0ABR9B4P2_9BACL|nr:cysteine hydrolase [Paenibacillus arenosi]MBD8500963.1 cysteine hydrolase [Paenibacillus arenosi]
MFIQQYPSDVTLREKEALILIEYQNEWLSKDGKIHHLIKDHQQFANSIESSKKLLEAARKTDIQIIHCGLFFEENHIELGNTTYGLRAAISTYKTFIKGSLGSQFGEAFTPESGEFVVSGRTGASGFAGSNLDSFLRNQGINKIYIAGYALHVCVESTLRHGHDLGYEVTVVEDATSAFTQEQRKHVLEHVVHHFGKSITVDQFIEKYIPCRYPPTPQS